MKRSGAADLPLHNGYVPQWLAERMAKLGLAVTEVLLAQRAEKDFIPAGGLDELIANERKDSWKYGGRTVFGKETPPLGEVRGRQLRLF